MGRLAPRSRRQEDNQEMTDYEIRAMLRGATKARLLTGWQGPHYNGTFSIAPESAGAYVCSREHAISLCLMMRQAHIKPLYRSSEPK
jgi:hypothetical protein